jgi:hypothetical protein
MLAVLAAVALRLRGRAVAPQPAAALQHASFSAGQDA